MIFPFAERQIEEGEILLQKLYLEDEGMRWWKFPLPIFRDAPKKSVHISPTYYVVKYVVLCLQNYFDPPLPQSKISDTPRIILQDICRIILESPTSLIQKPHSLLNLTLVIYQKYYFN